MLFSDLVLRLFFGKVSKFAFDRMWTILDTDNEYRRLERTILKVQSLLAHVDADHSRNKAYQMWRNDLTKLLYDAEDMVDAVILGLGQISCDKLNNDKTESEIRNMLISSLQLDMPNEIKKLLRELESVAGEMSNSFFMESVKSSDLINNFVSSGYNRSSSFAEEMTIVGREKEKNALCRLVSEEGNSQSVIPIVGMGGIGKTAIAQAVYNDKNVMEKFELRIWISVSVDFDIMRISKSIVESITKKSCTLLDLDEVQVELQSSLKGKKFLLVLDDVWCHNHRDWDLLLSPLGIGQKCSKIIVTTRSSIVSMTVSNTLGYNLECLGDKECWDIMKQHALLGYKTDHLSDLETIGKLIAVRCRGLPLVAKTLGSVLQFKSNVHEWSDLLRTELWDLQHENNFFSSLRLSYFQLPVHLKKCFKYCATFPLNYEFEKDNLVLIWMAEGFIQCVGEKRLEDIGEDYFKVLLGNSFFEPSDTNTKNPTTYKIPELLHSMAKFFCEDIYHTIDTCIPNWGSVFKGARHMFLRHSTLDEIPWTVFNKYKKLRTLLIGGKVADHIVTVPVELFSNLGSLKVLDLSQTRIVEVPSVIGNSKQLRYLNLSTTPIKNLPESICKIFCLQTLKLKNCSNLLWLPQKLRRLINLRHLDIEIEKSMLMSMPPKIGRMTNLQTLNEFIVGVDDGCRIEELSNMVLLKGSICVSSLENVRSGREAESAMLKGKPYIDKLELKWSKYRDELYHSEILSKLQPHNNLKELKITNYGGRSFPIWLHDLSSCSMVVHIHFKNCNNCLAIPPLGSLPHLKTLFIDGMRNLVIVDKKFCGPGTDKWFPSLETLKFDHMEQFKIWVGINPNDMPALSSITINDCPRLTCLPSIHHLRSLKYLDINLCPTLKSFPEEGLPSSLQSLIILKSDILQERCKVDGPDWVKISGVKKIEMNYARVNVEAATI